MSDAYELHDGVFRLAAGVSHRDEQYDSSGFDTLRDMQARHFWYRGRHRFLWRAVQRTLRRVGREPNDLRMIDLGGGCGGWVSYLAQREAATRETALADSSLRALSYAADVLPAGVSRYQIDLMRLEWRERWDVAFLLDVLEHIPEDEEALRQIHAALTPGGLLFVTTPALQRFWTYNDELAHHVRRYSRADFQRLAATCGFQCLDTRYFMFFLSPLLLASRLLGRVNVARMTEADRRALLARTHRVPNTAVNTALAAVFGAETPLGHRLSFPWGTSVLAVLRKAGG